MSRSQEDDDDDGDGEGDYDGVRNAVQRILEGLKSSKDRHSAEEEEEEEEEIILTMPSARGESARHDAERKRMYDVEVVVEFSKKRDASRIVYHLCSGDVGQQSESSSPADLLESLQAHVGTGMSHNPSDGNPGAPPKAPKIRPKSRVIFHTHAGHSSPLLSLSISMCMGLIKTPQTKSNDEVHNITSSFDSQLTSSLETSTEKEEAKS